MQRSSRPPPAAQGQLCQQPSSASSPSLPRCPCLPSPLHLRTEQNRTQSALPSRHAWPVLTHTAAHTQSSQPPKQASQSSIAAGPDDPTASGSAVTQIITGQLPLLGMTAQVTSRDRVDSNTQVTALGPAQPPARPQPSGNRCRPRGSRRAGRWRSVRAPPRQLGGGGAAPHSPVSPGGRAGGKGQGCGRRRRRGEKEGEEGRGTSAASSPAPRSDNDAPVG